MDRVTCEYCGLPFRVRRSEPGRPVYCCTGCAMLGRIPVDDQGQFPVNGHLVSALVTGFVVFNQLLFWLVAELLVREGRAAQAARFFWLSAGAAGAVWLSLLWLQWREREFHTAEKIAMLAGVAGLGAAYCQRPPPPALLAGLSAALAVWTFRGLLLKAFRFGSGEKKTPKP